MARLVRNTKNMTIGVTITTVFENSTKDRSFKIGDIVEGIRYIKDGEIEKVSGRISDITYTMASRLSWNRLNPGDTINRDVMLVSLVIDASTQYNSNIIEIPLREVVEWEDEADVVRMKYAPYIIYDMQMYYTDYRTQTASVQVGDVFNNVKILDPANVGVDITGKFEVIGFAYAAVNGKINVTGIAFKDTSTGKSVVADIDNILALTEVYKYDVSSPAAIIAAMENLADNDTILVGETVNTTGAALNINKKDVDVVLNGDLIADGSVSSGIRISDGNAIISGTGKIISTTPYDSNHGKGALSVAQGGEVTFNGGGVSAVVADDPVNKGQFGVTVYGNGKVTVNDGHFEAGWYCLSGNGSGTNADSVTTINGGTFRSVADYAIYHPHAGKLVINDGEIAGAAGAIAANNGIIEINGGDFSVLGGGNTGEWADGTSGLTDVALNLNAKYGDIVCRITGGTFHATAAGTIMIKAGTAHNVDLKIFGGKFSSKPNDEWIAEGYACTTEPDADGYYVVEAVS